MGVEKYFYIHGLYLSHVNLVSIGFNADFEGSWTSRQHCDRILVFELLYPLFCLDSLRNGFGEFDDFYVEISQDKAYLSSFGDHCLDECRCLWQNPCLLSVRCWIVRDQFFLFIFLVSFGSIWFSTKWTGLLVYHETKKCVLHWHQVCSVPLASMASISASRGHTDNLVCLGRNSFRGHRSPQLYC